MATRVLLADDHPSVRAGVCAALGKAPGIVVVAEAADGEDALRLIEQQQPDVALLDCRLPKLNGVEVAALVRKRGLPTRVLALSAYTDDEYVHGMLESGAAGYLLKEEALDTVVEAVQAAARGEEWYSRRVLAQVTAWARGETSVSPDVARLTDRELDVLRLLARGWDNSRIAQELVITEGTVKNHITSIYGKLGVSSRAEATAWAWERRLIAER
ncbi:MAG TPA: response regulator transcription factor [Anaerolineae bacterium]|nr:response regulator transcription factor [Anaerolineae bacterium]